MVKIYCIFLLLLIVSCKQKDKDVPQIEQEIATPVEEPKQALDTFKPPSGWQEFTNEKEGFVTDVKYATTDNFVKEVMYNCGKCFLRDEAADQLVLVAKALKKKNLQLKLFDCYRPAPVQQRLWDKVPNASYVTPPWRGSQHNRGVAVDLTITDLQGNELDMGTAFDYFGEEAHHTYKAHSQEIEQNRKLLKTLMEQHGFASIRTEWWHYSIAKLKHLEVSEWEWECPDKF